MYISGLEPNEFLPNTSYCLIQRFCHSLYAVWNTCLTEIRTGCILITKTPSFSVYLFHDVLRFSLLSKYKRCTKLLAVVEIPLADKWPKWPITKNTTKGPTHVNSATILVGLLQTVVKAIYGRVRQYPQCNTTPFLIIPNTHSLWFHLKIDLNRILRPLNLGLSVKVQTECWQCLGMWCEKLDQRTQTICYQICVLAN